MAEKRYVAHAFQAAQVDTATPANVEIGDVFTMKLADAAGREYTLTYTAAAATVKDACDGLTAAAAVADAAGYAPWNACATTDDDSVVTVTADSADAPFTLTCTATNGGAADTQDLTRDASTACDGPGRWASALNWSGEALPAANDDLLMPAELTATIHGSDTTGTVYSSLTIEAGCTAAVGTSANYLQIDVGGTGDSVVDLAGSGSVYLDVDNAAEINVTGGSTSGGYAAGAWPINLKGLDNAECNIAPPADTDVKVQFANLAGDGAAECTAFVVAAGELTIGPSVTQADGASAVTITASGGAVYCRSAAGTVTLTGDADYCQVAGAVATIHAMTSGTVEVLSETTITALHLGPHAHLDLTRGEGAVTVTDSTLYIARSSGAKITDPANRLTRTNASTIKRSGSGYVQILTGAAASA